MLPSSPEPPSGPTGWAQSNQFNRATRLATLRAELTHLGPLADEHVNIAGTDITVSLLRPSDTDLLLDQVADDPEQNLPYWAELWPSGIALAGAIAREPELLRGRRVIELGCGLGATAATAVAAGARLLATDYAPDALLLTRYNALRYAGAEPATQRLNWRRPDDPLAAPVEDDFAVVLAADVLYEVRDVGPLLDLVERITAPDGLLWLAEPGRRPAARFLAQAATRGWSGPGSSWTGPWPDPKDEGTTVRIHQLRRQPKAGSP